jgi:hypothetical protein
VDSVRGGTKYIISESTNAEGTLAVAQLFTSTGMIVSNDASANSLNSNGSTKVSWGWLGSNTTASNTSGSISSTVCVNQTSGFSIVSYTGNGSAGATVGHGLGAVPKMMIHKDRTTAGYQWGIYTSTLGPTKNLNFSSGASNTSSTYYNDTAPTSSVFSLGTNVGYNANTDSYIAYCFAEIKGYSKFGSYTSNANADGPFVYCGFKPAFVLLKNSQSGGTGWWMWTGEIPEYNVINKRLNAESASSESTANMVDFLSNGFKIRSTGDSNYLSDINIFMAFAENPFVTSGGIPNTAR